MNRRMFSKKYCDNCTQFVYIVCNNRGVDINTLVIYDNLESAIKYIYKHGYDSYFHCPNSDFFVKKMVLNEENVNECEYVFNILPKESELKNGYGSLTKEMWDRVIEEYPDNSYLKSLLKET